MVSRKKLDKWVSKSFLALGIVFLLFLFMFYVSSGSEVQQSALDGGAGEEAGVPLSLAVAGIVFAVLNAALESHTGQVIMFVVNVLFYMMVGIIVAMLVLIVWKKRKKR